MRREQIVPAVMPMRLYHLLLDLHDSWSRWRPNIGYPSHSAGLSSGGVVTEFDDMADEADSYAVRVVSAAWDQLGMAQRIAVEQTMGWLSPVATVREGVLEGAIASLVAKCQAGGVM